MWPKTGWTRDDPMVGWVREREGVRERDGGTSGTVDRRMGKDTVVTVWAFPRIRG